ncbi:hypothetical protein SAMN06265348_103368 [Pedobacter westerhofensis]|uniref:Uncharacterized protein n=1 Tax=Pedobacter westerhofensis TaxID=425512 RepID=A0A521CAE5_9SPHI|nr:hypothetical protein [Pedobacter westerhofensis]SMO56335.1 hypothetical protein SAMN06265348_103368 [Pedobacter westerhofensis]
MTVMQPEIDKLKEEFNNITNSSAEEKPLDFYAYLHLREVNRIEKLMSYMELSNNISHKPTWAEMKNYLDDESEVDAHDSRLA